MFTATVINFVLAILGIGTEVAEFIVFIQKTFILDIEYPLLERPKLLVTNAIRNMSTVNNWARNLPVSIKLSQSYSGSINVRWRYYSAISLSFGGLGPSSKIDSG